MAIEKEFVPSFFRVSITNGGGLLTAGNAAGFIDFKSIEDYGVLPTSLVLSLDKKRANMRYRQLIFSLEDKASITEVRAAVATAADENTPAIKIEFTLMYDDDSFLLVRDETAALPNTFLPTKEDALKRLCARALISNLDINGEVLDPSIVGGQVKGSSILRVSADALSPDISTAEAQITVIRIANI